ncbi:protein of unknown function [Candidatus Hydrogenisulfobacillus filiaventi]|uniref:Uncharacterized protein n=1 Tax=Candidatus Hydrogenisulfobacillus filiaventi TaxID=2707344 RepID=A0A6F8ZDH2_9FIRM|nr:protein of unknown function [Candidatus Hydrogenisulfobacillus filiaventi]
MPPIPYSGRDPKVLLADRSALPFLQEAPTLAGYGNSDGGLHFGLPLSPA